MNDFVMGKLKEYVSKNQSKAYALRNWINLNMKKFSLVDALGCIYRSTGGNFNEMTKVIEQLTEKRKVYGRTQVYNADNAKMIDIVDVNGRLTLKGYDPDKEPTPKGQHLPKNHNIYRKSDDNVSKIYQNAEKAMLDLGKEVRELYPNQDKAYIQFAMNAIRKYAAAKKLNVMRVVNSLKTGRLVLDDDYFKVMPAIGESKTVIISRRTLNEMSDEWEMTEYKFNSNIKRFLHDLLEDPINAQPTKFLKANIDNLSRSKLIRMLRSVGLLEISQKISDKDENGEPKDATMKVRYLVPKQNFNRKLKKLYIRLFERNLPERQTAEKIEEDGEAMGATSADASGQFSQPLFGVQRKKIYNTGMAEATTTFNTGDYQYDVPFAGDAETLARKNGVGGSVSVNKA